MTRRYEMQCKPVTVDREIDIGAGELSFASTLCIEFCFIHLYFVSKDLHYLELWVAVECPLCY